MYLIESLWMHYLRTNLISFLLEICEFKKKKVFRHSLNLMEGQVTTAVLHSDVQQLNVLVWIPTTSGCVSLPAIASLGSFI